MSIRDWFRSRLAALWERQSRIKDLDRELESHLIWNWKQKSNRNPACHSRKHVMPLDELSATPRWSRRTRAIWNRGSLERLARDIRYGARALRP